MTTDSGAQFGEYLIECIRQAESNMRVSIHTAAMARKELLHARELVEAALPMMEKLADELTGINKNVPKSHWASEWERMEKALAACKLENSVGGASRKDEGLDSAPMPTPPNTLSVGAAPHHRWPTTRKRGDLEDGVAQRIEQSASNRQDAGLTPAAVSNSEPLGTCDCTCQWCRRPHTICGDRFNWKPLPAREGER